MNNNEMMSDERLLEDAVRCARYDVGWGEAMKGGGRGFGNS